MEELFRFSVIRAADRGVPSTVALARPPAPPPVAAPPEDANYRKTTPGTLPSYVYGLVPTTGGAGSNLPIPQKSFQDQLKEIVQNSSADHISPYLIWKNLEPVSINFVITQAYTILSNPLWNSLQTFQTGVTDLVANGTGDTKSASAISALFDQQNALKNQDAFTSYAYDLGDLFIALLIIRRGGPSNTDSIIRSQNPPLWSLAELLTDKPTLQEISDHINSIGLLQAGYASIAPPPSVKAAADIKTAIQTAFQKAMNTTLLLPPGIFAQFEKPIHGLGFREFHVVKQHIRGYEMGEIARIENILKGELRDHSTKHTLSNDTTTFSQTVSTTENTKELDSTDHTNIQNETQDQVKEDTKVDAGVHASYDGGSYKIQADLTVAYDKSSDSTMKFASDVSKDVTQKASSKVTQQVTQSKTVQIIETFEDHENQKFDNTKAGGAHISGVYQWINKVYLAQTFSLGRHLLFDLMVPEPAASYISLIQNKQPDPEAPVKPEPPGNFSPETLTSASIANVWIGKYQASAIDPYPFDSVVAAKAIHYDFHDDSKPGGADVITIPDGYYASLANVSANWLRNDGADATFIDVAVGDGSARLIAAIVKDMPSCVDKKVINLYAGDQGSIGFAFMTYNVNGMSINIEVVCKPSQETIARWQQQAYQKIITAYQKMQSDYESKIASSQFLGTALGSLGTNPDANRMTERLELKRSCIAIIDNANETVRGLAPNTSVELFPATALSTGQPTLPEPVLQSTPDKMGNRTSQDLGISVRWFEQAFEWENMAYIFYPYFWGRRGNWQQNLNAGSDDPLFVNFIRAGYARVIVPVRLGFEKAVHFYLHTGLPWLGGGLPSIGDKTQNPLYLDIAEEIKAMTGGPETDEIETPIGDPWDINLPTSLVKLRKDDLLPSWNRIGPNVITSPAPPKLGPDPAFPSDPPIGPWTWREEDPPKPLPYSTS